MRRPDVFTLDYSHPLAQGLVFAFLRPQRGASSATSSDIAARQGLIDSYSATDSYQVFSGRAGYGDNRLNLGFLGFPVTPDLYINKFQPKTVSSWFHIGVPRPDLVRYGLFTELLGCYSLGAFATTVRFGVFDSNNIIRNEVGFPYTAQANEFLHLAAVYGADNMQHLYLNGSLVASAGWSSWASTNATSVTGLRLRAAHIDTESERVISGGVFDPLIYNRALSPAEIALLADRTDPLLGGLIVEDRPVLWFDMGGGGVTYTLYQSLLCPVSMQAALVHTNTSKLSTLSTTNHTGVSKLSTLKSVLHDCKATITSTENYIVNMDVQAKVSSLDSVTHDARAIVGESTVQIVNMDARAKVSATSTVTSTAKSKVSSSYTELCTALSKVSSGYVVVQDGKATIIDIDVATMAKIELPSFGTSEVTMSSLGTLTFSDVSTGEITATFESISSVTIIKIGG